MQLSTLLAYCTALLIHIVHEIHKTIQEQTSNLVKPISGVKYN